MPKIKVVCKYCGHRESTEWEAGMYDCDTFDEVLDNDIEYMCSGCGCPVRFNEAMEEEVTQ